jgi:hypothetical protein
MASPLRARSSRFSGPIDVDVKHGRIDWAGEEAAPNIP